MTADMEDPVTRETMALEWIVESWHSHPPEFTSPPTMDEVRLMLQVLDSFDPLRAMLGEVVKKLWWIRAEVNPDRMRATGHVPDEERIYYLATDLLTRLRTLTPTEGGTDDETR